MALGSTDQPFFFRDFPEASMEKDVKNSTAAKKVAILQEVSLLSWFIMIHTPPKFNIAPEKWCLEDYIPFGKAYFQGLC